MRERPILFNATMVRALLDGTKTQTRRVCNPQFMRPPDDVIDGFPFWDWPTNYGGTVQANTERGKQCPFGKEGDRLWVRETTRMRYLENILTGNPTDHKAGAYFADDEPVLDPAGFDFSWWYSRDSCPSIHMPRWASRITLEITGVRVDRLQDISEADARAEGVLYVPGHGSITKADLSEGYSNYLACRMGYEILWNEIHGPGAWSANPWLWVVEFKRV